MGHTCSSTACFFNCQNSTIFFFTGKPILCCLGLLRCSHLDESKSTRFPCVRIKHNLSPYNLAILLEQLFHFFLSHPRGYAANEQIGAWIICTRFLTSVITKFIRTRLRIMIPTRRPFPTRTSGSWTLRPA